MKPLFRCDEDERDFGERQKFELRGASVGQGGDSEIDFSGEHLFDGLLGGTGTQFELNVGTGGAIGFEQFGEQAVDGGDGGVEGERSADGGRVVQFLLESLPFLPRLPGIGLKAFAGGREGDAAIIAHEERMADFFFQSLDGAGERRRAEVARAAGFAEVEGVGECQEVV